MLAGARKLGVVPVALLPGEIRRPFGRSRRLVAPADYRAVIIGIRPSRVAAMTFRALGGRARGYVPGDLRGFDGAELDLTTRETNESYDTRGTSLAANVNLWPRALVVVVNRAVYRRLTPAQRAILRHAGVAAIAPAVARLESEEDRAAQSLCSRGRLSFVTASPAELAALRARVQPVYDELGRDPQTSTFLRAIAALRKGVEPEGAPGCTNTAPPPAKPAPLDGVYRMTVTKEQELRNDGVSPAHAIAENYGTFVWVVSRGRFAQTQESDHACTWAYGTAH
jgi:TRAP-type C4-dicarboxylate transport system substrate-binding protein